MQEMMFQHVSGPGSILREEAFISVCDLLIFFCANGDEGEFPSILLIPTQMWILENTEYTIKVGSLEVKYYYSFFVTYSSEELNSSSSSIPPWKTNGSVT